jgi:signal peptidase II
VKLRSSILLIAAIIIADQALKFWIKTSFSFGHVTHVLGLKWFELYFIENEGMAWGWKFGGEWGKMALTLFRLVAVIFGTWYLVKIIREKYTTGFIVCASLIYAGALGNLIDSMFYGMLFSATDYNTIASFLPEKGYANFLHGHVVDMIHLDLIKTTYPEWFPMIGGRQFEFFSPIFNIADASISTGVITLLIFQKRFLQKEHAEETHPTVETSTETSDRAQVM